MLQTVVGYAKRMAFRRSIEMTRASSIPKPRGFKPYLYRAIEEYHLDALKRFLAFLHRKYETRLSFWADLFPILFDRPSPETDKQFKQIEARLVSQFTIEQCWKLQSQLHDGLEKMLEQARTPLGYKLVSDPLYLFLLRWPGEGEAYWIGTQFDLYDPGKPLRVNVLRRVADHLRGLRCAALRTCEQCKCFFIPADRRPAGFCSVRCRFAAVNQRRKEERRRRREKKKRG